MHKLGNILGSFIILMITLSFVSVTIGFLFKIVSIPLQEIIIYLHSVIFMIGSGYAYFHNKHVRIDIFHQKFSEKTKNKVDFYGGLLLLLPFCLFLIIVSSNYVLSSWLKFEGSAEVGGLPMIFLLKSLILIMPMFLIGLFVSTFIKKT